MGRVNAGALNGEPRTNWHLVARESLIAPVNERPNIWWKTDELRPPEEPVKHVRDMVSSVVCAEGKRYHSTVRGD